VFAPELSANEPLRGEIAAFAAAGGPIVAECGGLLYLCRELDGRPMCGVLPARARMTGTLSLGYREAAADRDSPCWSAGEHVRGHEFHYSAVEPPVGADPAWTLRARGRERREGFAAGAVHASFLHVHWAAFPHAAGRLVRAASRSRVAA
jgi:cobyrinic acid a,c-diamide synthase